MKPNIGEKSILIKRIIDRIEAKFPGLLHLVMFYNDGIVFHTSFTTDKEIPTIGEKLGLLLKYARKLIQIESDNKELYKKIIIESNAIIIMIIKIGEESNLAMFLANNPILDLDITPIRKYIKKLEELIDIEPITFLP